MRVQTARTDTADHILDLAERLVQTRGFNGFSYADIATELGVTKASLHYHFPTKAQLGYHLINRYGEVFARSLAEIDATRDVDTVEKLRSYVNLYSQVLRDNRMCLCGMLAADYTTLPEPMKSAVTQFFESERALVGTLAGARVAPEEMCSSRVSRWDVARLLRQFPGRRHARRSLFLGKRRVSTLFQTGWWLICQSTDPCRRHLPR